MSGPLAILVMIIQLLNIAKFICANTQHLCPLSCLFSILNLSSSGHVLFHNFCMGNYCVFSFDILNSTSNVHPEIQVICKTCWGQYVQLALNHTRKWEVFIYDFLSFSIFVECLIWSLLQIENRETLMIAAGGLTAVIIFGVILRRRCKSRADEVNYLFTFFKKYLLWLRFT